MGPHREESEIHTSQEGQVYEGTAISESGSIFALGGITTPVIAVFNARPMAASEVDPFFLGSLISSLTGEVVTLLDACFSATFYCPTAFYGDD